MIIDIKNATWQRGDKTILKDVSWQVKNGEHWCLLGLNGAGKTALLNLINGYMFPTKGDVTVLGFEFGKSPLPELRKLIGWVSSSLQQRLYGNDTVEEIILSGKFASIGLYQQPEENDIEKAGKILADLGCEQFRFRRYETLSQGERQKILIARALMASPKLLILDEPCTGLDIFAREQLLSMIDTIAKQPDAPTLIYVTHHVEEILPCFSHTLLLKQGEVFRAGKTADVLTEGELTDFFGTPLEVERKKERIAISLKS
ncbi:iron complex transport system ATP-binding protein [Scopulibacillus daqui]|uniref:Iron complex transport system ATP-binding protein n=1 Tax=Scopulibacillus daqui TaxID=1469162 RepID=A0ABS2Q338_9BACL|nr:ABC transporter ATP-binding protein [Scopulibacillus daqui]MBM7646631.1 iron complex transport system ATP-binding protein [Scopulibacillus daqui]